MILDLRRRDSLQHAGGEPEGPARRQARVRRRVRRHGRAARQGAGPARPPGGRRARPHRHRLAGRRRVRPHREDRRAGPDHRRRQHRHGLLPHVAAAGRQGRQGDGPPPAAVLQGVALGARRRRGRADRDPGQPRAQAVRASKAGSSSAWSSTASSGATTRTGARRRARSTASSSRRTTSSWPSVRRTRSPGSSATRASTSTRTACRSSTRPRCSRPGPGCSSAATRRSAPRTSSGRWRTRTRRRSRSTTTARASPITERPPQGMNLITQKMGLAEWSYSNDYNPAKRAKMKHVDLRERFAKLYLEVELGFDPEQTAREVERCLNCDIQTVFTDAKCIECDACIDVCPMHCLTIAPNGEEDDLRSRLTVAGRQQGPGPVRVGGAAADRTRDGQGRGRLRPLRAVRRAVSDGRLGHAEVRSQASRRWQWIEPVDERKAARTGRQAEALEDGARRARSRRQPACEGRSSTSHQRLRAEAGERQRHRLGQRERPADAGDLPHGHPGLGQEPVPVEHPGAADLVRDPRQQGRPRGARAGLRPGGRDERGDLRRATSRRSARAATCSTTRRWPLDAALARADVTFLGVPLAKMCNEIFKDSRERILMKNIAYARGAGRRCSTSTCTSIDELLEEKFAKKKALLDSNHKALRLGLRLREGAPRLPAADPAREDGRHRRSHPDRRQHRDRARVRVRRRDRRRLVSDHAVDVGDGRVQGVLRAATGSDPETGKNNYCILQAEDELAAIGMVIGASWNGARAFTSTSGPGHLADERADRPRLLRRDPGGHRRRPAHRSVDRDADAHAAGRHHDVRLRVARRHQAHRAVPGESRGVLHAARCRRSIWPSASRRRCSCCRTSTSA